MKFLKIALFSLACFAVMQVSAQSALNVEIGVNAANRYVNANDMKPFSNYTFGLSWDKPINDMLFVRIGAGFAEDSKKIYTDEGDQLKTRKSFTISNFDLPVTVGYKKELGEISLIGQAGLFWSKHLMGSSYSKIYNYNVQQEYYENIWFGKDASDWKKSDFGFIVKAGAEYKNFELAVSYAMGIIDQKNEEGVIYRPMAVFTGPQSYYIYDYGIEPEAVKRITVSLSYRFDLEGAETKIGQ